MKIDVTVDALAKLLELATISGTLPAWSEIAMDCLRQAEQSIKLLEAEQATLLGKNKTLCGENRTLRQLAAASAHLLRGSDAIYDPRGDTGPTHWLETRDRLIAELDAALRKYGE